MLLTVVILLLSRYSYSSVANMLTVADTVALTTNLASAHCFCFFPLLQYCPHTSTGTGTTTCATLHVPVYATQVLEMMKEFLAGCLPGQTAQARPHRWIFRVFLGA